MNKKDWFQVCILWLLVIAIFYPVFFTDYIYTDETVQLWAYKPGSGFNMFLTQGRWITDGLFYLLFSGIDTIHEVTYVRLFSLAGWMLCIPVWYLVLKKVVAGEPAYTYLPFFTCLYLVTSLPFSISIQWASCLELFVANTAGLVSGAFLYNGIRLNDSRVGIGVGAGIASVVFGLIALSTYQSGFGCFMIPFLLHFISRHTKQKDRMFITGMIVHFLIYALYFLLFKLSVGLLHIPYNDRTNLYIDPLDKIQFFFSHPFERSFWMNIIVDENNSIARALYKVLFVGWMVLVFVRVGINNYRQALKQIAGVMLIFLVVSIPSLIVKENFASNRTMLALFICVWLVYADMFMYFIRNRAVVRTTAIALAVVLIVSAGYNFRRQFLVPVHAEYTAVKDHIRQHYHPGIKTVHFILATEDAFRKKYGIRSTMDEFGVPSTFFDWVAEYLPRQIVYEMTGNKAAASELQITHWSDLESFTNSGEKINDSVLFIDMPGIIASMPPQPGKNQ